MNRARPARKGILCAGNFIIDYVALIDHYPAEETLADVLSTSTSNGGAAYNVLVDLAHLGVRIPLEALGLVGDDAEGKRILDHCKALGIDIKQLLRAPGGRTSYSDILTVKSTGRRTIIHDRGANALLAEKHFDFKKTNAKILHLAFLSLLDRLDAADKKYGTVAAKVLARARAAGMITVADVVSDASGRLPRVVEAALPHLDYLFLNEIEARLVTGIDARHTDGTIVRAALEQAARVVIERGLRGWLILHTAEVAVAVKAGEPSCWQNSIQFPAAKIVGTNGAGDAFAAGFLAAMHDGQAMQDVLRTAACVAASSLTDGTPSAGVKKLRACLKLGETLGFRT